MHCAKIPRESLNLAAGTKRTPLRYAQAFGREEGDFSSLYPPLKRRAIARRPAEAGLEHGGLRLLGFLPKSANVSREFPDAAWRVQSFSGSFHSRSFRCAHSQSVRMTGVESDLGAALKGRSFTCIETEAHSRGRLSHMSMAEFGLDK